MYAIHFLTSWESDQPVDAITFIGNRLNGAIERARSIIGYTASQPSKPGVVGFRILDNAGHEAHREYFRRRAR
jgi:hypothetical protein